MTADPTPEAAVDRRVRRTRTAVVSAFNRMILERGYAALTPGEVAKAADVGRSTFYEHFSGLNDLLGRAIGPVLAPLAQGCFEEVMPRAAVRSIEHLWENRRLARALLVGEAQKTVLASFAGQFASALGCMPHRDLGGARLEPELIALQVAAGQLAVLGAWLSGRSVCSAQEVAQALHASGRASIKALSQLPASSQCRE